MSTHDDFTAYVTARGPTLVRLARRLLPDPHYAEDVTQEVLARAYRRWDGIMAGGHPDAYLRTALVNESISFRRRAARREGASGPAGDVAEGASAFGASSSATGDPAPRLADRDHTLQLLRRLPARQRTVLVLRHYEDLSDAQIAATMGIREPSVRSAAHRGLATLRRMLDQETEPHASFPRVPSRSAQEVPTHD